MGLTTTHTYAELEVSAEAYAEIEGKLREAGYDHAFMDDGTIDMHGIGIVLVTNQHKPLPPPPEPTTIEKGGVPRPPFCTE